MIVLDTDYLTLLEHKTTPVAQRLYARLKASGEPLTTTIVNFEEQMRGWMGHISQAKNLEQQIARYRYLQDNLQLFCGLNLLAFTVEAAHNYAELRKAKIRVPTMDLKIASIVIAFEAKLLSRNLRDFQKIPGLTVEDWTQ